MKRQIVNAFLTASLIVLFSEAVLSCSKEDADLIHAQSERALYDYHWPAVLLGLGVLVLFFIRRFRGIVILLFTVAALAISPGWFPMINAGVDPDCSPSGSTEIKVILGFVAVCFVAQLLFWIFERRQRLNSNTPSRSEDF